MIKDKCPIFITLNFKNIYSFAHGVALDKFFVYLLYSSISSLLMLLKSYFKRVLFFFFDDLRIAKMRIYIRL